MGDENTIPRILVVDDEPLIRSGISRCLADRAEVVTAESAEEALEAIGASYYHLCLLDVYLPGMNGLDAMKKINKISPTTKVAIMTGSSLDEAMKKEILDKAYAFIEKPFNLSRIREVAGGVVKTAGHHQPLSDVSIKNSMKKG